MDDKTDRQYVEKPPTTKAKQIAFVSVTPKLSVMGGGQSISVSFVGDEESFYDITDIANYAKPSEGDYLVFDESKFDWVFMRKDTFEQKYAPYDNLKALYSNGN